MQLLSSAGTVTNITLGGIFCSLFGCAVARVNKAAQVVQGQRGDLFNHGGLGRPKGALLCTAKPTAQWTAQVCQGL